MIKAADLDAALGGRRAAARGVRRPGRGPARSRTCPRRVAEPPVASVPTATTSSAWPSAAPRIRDGRGGHPGPRLRRHRPRRGRGAGGLRRRHRALAARRAPAQPGRLDRHHRAEPGASTGCAASRARPGPPGRGAGARRSASPSRAAGRTSARRPAAPHLHLLPPGARPRGAGGAHPAADRRAADAGDRPRLPRARADDGAAAGARQAEDPGRGHPVPGARPITSCPSGCPPCSPSSTWCSTRATPPPRATAWPGRTCAPRRSGSARLLVALMPDEPEVPGLLALLLLTESRRAARTAPDGDLVLLADQDRGRVGPGTDRRGAGHRPPVPAPQPARALPGPGRDRRRAQRRGDGRAAPTGGRSSPSTTSCSPVAPTPVVALNRAVALAEVDGPAAALALVDAARPGRLPPVPRDPGRPAAPPRPPRRGRRGLRPGHRTGRERGGARLPHRAPRRRR